MSPTNSAGGGEKQKFVRGLYHLDRHMYLCLKLFIRGHFRVPYKNWTTFHKRCYMRWYRHKDLFSISNGEILFDGKAVIVDEDKKMVLHKELKISKGTGAKRMFHRLKHRYVGMSERCMQTLMSTSETHQLLNKQFTNKPPPSTVTAKFPQERHQIDLMDIGSRYVYKINDVSYRYILTVMDVFSRYVWLEALPDKTSLGVRNKLRHIYQHHGQPSIIQCDQGGEFKGKVGRYCDKNKIKMIRSRPYHPQSQGKVERCHRLLRRKIAFDLIRNKTGRPFNWVKHVQEYAKAMNRDPRSTLQFKTPFEAYYGREANEGDRQKTLPENNSRAVTSLRQCINDFTEKNTETLRIKYPEQYEQLTIGQKVLVRDHAKGKKVSYRSHVNVAIVTQIGKRNRYQVKTTSRGETQSKWYNITDLRKLQGFNDMKFHRKQYFIPIKATDSDIFADSGFRVRLNPIGDGSCQFAAVSDQLRSVLGIEHSPQSLRFEIVKYLHKIKDHLAPFVEGSIGRYLQEISRDSTFGDHLTLQAMSDYFSIDIQVVLTSGVNYCMLTPQASQSITTVYLGYLPEGQGEHYLSLQPNTQFVNQDVDETCQGDHGIETDDATYWSVNNTGDNTGDGYTADHPLKAADFTEFKIQEPSQSIETINLCNLREGQEENYPSLQSQPQFENQDMELSYQDDHSIGTDDDLDRLKEHNGDSIENGQTSDHRDATALNEFNICKVIDVIDSCCGDSKYIMCEDQHDLHEKSVIGDPIVEVATNSDTTDSWSLPLEITIIILTYAASVDISCRQRLRCVCKSFLEAMNLVVKMLPTPSLYLSPGIESRIGAGNGFLPTSVSICKILRIAGANSGLALQLRSLLQIQYWARYWLLLVRNSRPGWYSIARVYWRAKHRE